jgi:hypothetical protein
MALVERGIVFTEETQVGVEDKVVYVLLLSTRHWERLWLTLVSTKCRYESLCLLFIVSNKVSFLLPLKYEMRIKLSAQIL